MRTTPTAKTVRYRSPHPPADSVDPDSVDPDSGPSPSPPDPASGPRSGAAAPCALPAIPPAHLACTHFSPITLIWARSTQPSGETGILPARPSIDQLPTLLVAGKATACSGWASQQKPLPVPKGDSSYTRATSKITDCVELVTPGSKPWNGAAPERPRSAQASAERHSEPNGSLGQGWTTIRSRMAVWDEAGQPFGAEWQSGTRPDSHSEPNRGCGALGDRCSEPYRP